LGLASGDQVRLSVGSRSVVGPAWISPGHADGAVTVHLGYGRTYGGRVADGAGFSASSIRFSAVPWIAQGAELRATGASRDVATTQHHSVMEGRNLVRSATIGIFDKNPGFAREMGEDPKPDETLYPRFQYTGYAWGLSVDLNACVGCNACVVGCQSENNIPVVGRTEVTRGREMHWIRIDRYYAGEPADPETLFQPVMCQHCEDAPCEVVCPVGATVHSSEGLNEMVYNRCVGTRYCSNNCPYKVRRFNFFYFQDPSPTLKLLRNPDVTVRSRGVMEKCSYCIQRINLARIAAEKEDRKIRDGEIVTACQQACPADAIVFGDINDPESRVSKLKADPRSYGILTELNTRPRTTYLASLRNPNPEITPPAAEEAAHG
ncbi:MAG TPA: 4Fe-4S dicluster domain-containing protein, partial [Candidatus Saccharimonadales bacterium]|nr:4Fe-4S dicluster domain-containing protein [Candidatus Saccharimonadales bacterium]